MIRFWSIVCVVFLTVSVTAFGNEMVIRDVENLRNSLPAKDSARKELTLRLADLYFFAAVDHDKQARLATDGGAQALDQKAARARQRALNLYREAIRHGLNGETRIKVDFQMARLLDQLGRSSEALPLWRKSHAQKQVLNIRREAILKLAERAESSSSLKEAENLYQEALGLCESACNFVHYRLGWVYRNQGNIKVALQEIKKALWDKKGQAQEEVLRDYMAFLAQDSGDGSSAVSIVENLMERTGRKDLLENLAYGFYAAGNKQAGTNILAIVTAREPNIKNQIRLLEEYYGLRKWDQYRELRERVDPATITSIDPDSQKDAEKIMRRLAVQLEAEQKQNDSVRPEFLATNSLYLDLFPKSDIAVKVMRSWLSIEKNNNIKIAKIASWLNSPARQFKDAEILELREERARLAQEENNYPVLREEMTKLQKMYTDTEKREKAKYLIAHSYYKEGNIDQALPLFKELAAFAGDVPSKWAIQAQNLALDIYNQKQDFVTLIAQADTWLGRTWPQGNKPTKELIDIRKVREQANFEFAAASGTTPNALGIFYQYCNSGEFLPKSCENAKKLAVALKDQEKLMAVLRKTNAKEELINEYEISGHYAKSAGLLAEKTPLTKGKWSFEEAMKIALLYELAGNFTERDRWLKPITKRYYKKAIPEASEQLLYSTLKDARMLNSEALKIKWSKPFRLQLVRHLEESGQSTKQSRKLLMAQKENQGKVWEYYHLKDLFELARKERATKFYGRGSKRKFERRLARIKKFDQAANAVLEQLSSEPRMQVIALLHHSYKNLDAEIRATPIPDGLEEAAVAQIKTSLEAMARPFSEKSKSYMDLYSTELAKITDLALREKFAGAISEDMPPKVLLAQTERPEAQQDSVKSLSAVFPLLTELHKNPLSPTTLGSLKEFYTKQGRVRLASYYEGRLRLLDGGTK